MQTTQRKTFKTELTKMYHGFILMRECVKLSRQLQKEAKQYRQAAK